MFMESLSRFGISAIALSVAAYLASYLFRLLKIGHCMASFRLQIPWHASDSLHGESTGACTRGNERVLAFPSLL